VEEVDGLIATANWPAASKLLRKGFLLDPGHWDTDLIERVSNHNLGILSRMLIISEKQGRSLSNLAVIEDLIISRRETLRSYLEAFNTKEALLKKRRRETPAWALQEYKNKISELLDKLLTNQRSIESQAEKAFLALARQQEQSEITYH
jgi:hypothetical protein